MKYFKNLSVCFVLLIMMLPVISACSSDDDESVDWNSYILGTWRSYKGTLYYMGETVTVSIDKTGPYSSAYWEMTFKQNGDMKIGYWKPENYTTWKEENTYYYLKSIGLEEI